ncbi:MAG TPA: FG-GAP repeat protein, partial [Clostridia bacterium]|nr:FG-GAP repeat protein [Clostridia bacterium]
DLVDFGDFDGDGVNDIAIGWTQFTSGTDLRLSVYSLKAKTYKRVYSGSFTTMKVLDINNDGKQDILLVEQDTVAKKSTARLVSYSCGRLSEIASVPLDSTVSSYAELYETTVGKNDKGVLLDGYKGAHSMVTELVYWKNGSLQVPLYDKRSGTVISTFRDDPVACSDLDEDGTVEIPFPVVMQGYEKAAYSKKLWTVRWADFAPATGSGSVFQTKFSCVINSAEHYYFILPGDLVKKTGFAGNVTVDKKNGDNDWIFCQWDPKSKSEGRLLFAIRSYTTQEWSSLTNKKSLNVIYQNDLTTYAAILGQKQGNDDPLYLTLDQIRNNFKIIS